MKLLLYSPHAKGSTKGNRITAVRWSKTLRQLGHRVVWVDDDHPIDQRQQADGLIALHAVHSAPTIRQFRQRNPHGRIIVCLTGTDIHCDLPGDRGKKHQALAIKSLEMADRLILLEPKCKSLLSIKYHHKACVIYQSATPILPKPAPLKRSFEVTVIGHLRDEKDPFRAAMAVRNLPASSKIQLKHLGGAYSLKFATEANRESASNSRYCWLGELTHGQTQRCLARSRLTVLTSRVEGAPSVISEAIVNVVPILATRITGCVGMLGADYPGLFEVGDTDRLTELLALAETDPTFYQRLQMSVGRLKPRFHIDAERIAWQTLLENLE